MKTKSICVTGFLSLLFVASSYAQILAEEVRPFDFSDKYYQVNGVIASMLIGRKNGADGESVFDFTNDRKYSNVRITSTFPGYDASGGTIFWNYYAGVSKAGFTEDDNGQRVVALAYEHPLYLFPSTTVKQSFRQSAMARIDESYYDKNDLGIAAVYVVEYSERIVTKEGREVLAILAKRNGISLDGTPIIRTAKEIDSLQKEGLITLSQPALDEAYSTPFAIAKVIRFPELGGITPDSFLNYVKTSDGKPLEAEAHFVSTFECHKSGEKCL
jgi:hypothetical protein